nr:M28 family peptidase [Kibdelosporangium sp. MJ126-NF4]CEL18506.1 Aminopeptidase Y (Arg, Lys, Leu preference) [Kibdelosporangium sp. MJ126-NF4]CTQ97990.1 Aminopeptidase Y (Arg, Lys, Leu preference) (EC 3.4.11.15) [Kibdelosporangium sp. MJ126-NF4]
MRQLRLVFMTMVLTAAAVVAVTVAPTAAANGPAKLAENLARKVTVDGINRHLIAFQRISDRNGGHRYDPSPGFQESLDYVTGKVRDAGFDVTLQEFSYDRLVIDAASVSVNGLRTVPIRMQGSPQTPVDGVTANLVVVPVDATTGCEAGDYAGLNAAGAVVLIRRGGCSFAAKERVAADAGAVAAVVYNNSPGPTRGDVDPATARIPIVGITGDDGAALAGKSGGRATVVARDHYERTVSHNLIAQTRTGRTDNVVMAGAHLDSVPGSPSMNENATGVSTLLETALRLGSAPRIENAVRFAWFGGSFESVGSDDYLNSLSFDQQLDIAMYLAIEAIGSSNGGYFVYDGDNSDGVVGPMPYGSAQIERAFVDYFAGRGIQAEGTHIGQTRGEYFYFIAAGIPTGGPYTGIQFIKTEAQAAKWGGTAGAAFHPCHDAPCDNLGSINRPILDKNADAVAFVTGSYAMSTEDVNGVPSRARRAAARTAAMAKTGPVKANSPTHTNS